MHKSLKHNHHVEPLYSAPSHLFRHSPCLDINRAQPLRRPTPVPLSLHQEPHDSHALDRPETQLSYYPLDYLGSSHVPSLDLV